MRAHGEEGWLTRLFGVTSSANLDAAQRERLSDWQQRPDVDLDTPHAACRYVVVDVETSGLDMKRDRLIAIGAVAVVEACIDPSDSFAAVLRQDVVSSRENILIHGIGAQAQSEGSEPADALLDFLDYIGKSPLVAYHAFFDQAMIAKALRMYVGASIRQPWIDLAWILPALFAEHHGRGHLEYHAPAALDDWLRLFAIENVMRHNAVADAYATAQLLQMAIAAGQRGSAPTPGALCRIEKARRWMQQSR
jgi:DNA polymerase-3 subunit epsilon